MIQKGKNFSGGTNHTAIIERGRPYEGWLDYSAKRAKERERKKRAILWILPRFRGKMSSYTNNIIEETKSNDEFYPVRQNKRELGFVLWVAVGFHGYASFEH